MLTQSEARAVVIGGGVIGTSVAYHLARAGWDEIVLVERHQIGSGSTWHSAGNIALATEDPVSLRLQRYALDLFGQLEAETGVSVGWQRSGRIVLLRSEASLARGRRIAEAGRKIGLDAAIISPGEASSMLPVVNMNDVTQALWVPEAGKLSPTDLTTVYARAAKRRGVNIMEQTRVTGFELVQDGVRVVKTDRGDIRAGLVVNCAGVWSRPLGEMAGVTVPIVANEHFYLLTEPVPGVSPSLPSFRDGDSLVYGREESGGLLIGVFDENAVMINLDELPADFSFGLLPGRWDKIEPYFPELTHRMPVLENVAIKTFINGPEGFTVDDRFVVGKAPKLANYFVCAGMNSGGVTYSAGYGRLMAEWIIEGKPSEDISHHDIARFAGHESAQAYLAERAPHLTSNHYRFVR